MKALRGPCLCPLVDGPHPDTRHPRSPSSLQMESPSLHALCGAGEGLFVCLAPRAQTGPKHTESPAEAPQKRPLRGSTAEAPPAAETAEAEQGQPSKYTSGPRPAPYIWLTATRSPPQILAKRKRQTQRPRPVDETGSCVWRSAPFFASTLRGAPQKSAKRKRVGIQMKRHGLFRT